MRQRSILWFSLSEATSIAIQANLLKPLINQHQLSLKQSSFEGPVDWASWGRFRVLLELRFRGERFGLPWGAIRAFVGSDSGCRGERFGGAIRAFVGSDSGFRGLSWGAIRAFVGSDLGFRGERFGFSWGAIRAFVGSDSGFRRFGFWWGAMYCQPFPRPKLRIIGGFCQNA